MFLILFPCILSCLLASQNHKLDWVNKQNLSFLYGKQISDAIMRENINGCEFVEKVNLEYWQCLFADKQSFIPSLGGYVYCPRGSTIKTLVTNITKIREQNKHILEPNTIKIKIEKQKRKSSFSEGFNMFFFAVSTKNV